MGGVEFENTIRRIAGPKENPERGISVPPRVVQNTNFEHGERVRVILEKIE